LEGRLIFLLYRHSQNCKGKKVELTKPRKRTTDEQYDGKLGPRNKGGKKYWYVETSRVDRGLRESKGKVNDAQGKGGKFKRAAGNMFSRISQGGSRRMETCFVIQEISKRERSPKETN